MTVDLVKRRIRLRIMELVRLFGCVQFMLGFLLLFFAFYCIYLHVGDTQPDTLVYYLGGIIAGAAVTVHSLISAVIYSKGQHIRTSPSETIAVSNTKSPIFVFIVTAPFVSAACVAGTVVTVAYGACAIKCSYGDNYRYEFNFGMSVFLIVLEVLSVLMSVLSFSILLGFSKTFGVNVKRSLTMMVGMHDGHADADVQREQDEVNLERWRHGIEPEVNFPKIRSYMSDSRPPHTGESVSTTGSDVSVIEIKEKTVETNTAPEAT